MSRTHNTAGLLWLSRNWTPRRGWKETECTASKTSMCFLNNFNELTCIKMSIWLVFWIATVKLAHLWRLRNNRKGFMNREWKSLGFWHIDFQYDNVLHILLCNLEFLRQLYFRFFFRLLRLNFLIIHISDINIYLNNVLLYFWNITFLFKMK